MPTLTRSCALAILLAALGNTAFAKKIYKYTDDAGIVHFTDVRPAAQFKASQTQVAAEHQTIIGLRIEGNAGERQARAYNHLAGPAEVELSFSESDNVQSAPGLPLLQVIPANSELVLAQIHQIDPERGAQFELSVRAMPGDPHAVADDYTYRWPLADPDAPISQGFDGQFSHTEAQSRYALDIGAKEGTPVLAARDGVVMQIENDYVGSGLDREKFADRANLVRILHKDGSMAIYAHLRTESICVQTGRHVYAGQKLGESGNTGFSTGPHLHFAIQLNRGFSLQSVPFRLIDAHGNPVLVNPALGAVDVPETP